MLNIIRAVLLKHLVLEWPVYVCAVFQVPENLVRLIW